MHTVVYTTQFVVVLTPFNKCTYLTHQNYYMSL